jgi:hypothetical protein
MRHKSGFIGSLAVSALLMLVSGSAFAQATRTWVSGVGDDVNPCSRTAPCKTFAGAISKTAAGGIINCIDSGAYGAVTITKSIYISCDKHEAGVLASSTNGVVINAAATDHIVLRGLAIDGSPPSSPGLNGVRFLAGGSLTIENCNIRDFSGAGPNGNGVLVANSASVPEIHIINSIISGNGTGTTGAGIQIAPTGSAGARVTVTNSVLLNNIVGLRVDTVGTTGAVDVVVTDTTASNASFHGFVALANNGPVRMMLDGIVASNNLGEGVRSVGANATVRIGRSTVSANGTGLVSASSGQLLSYGTNQVNGNTVDGNPTGPVAMK